MKKGSTLFLKIALFLIGLPVLAICVFWLPGGFGYLPIALLGGAYATAGAFYFALFQAFRLLTYIDGNEAFSEKSVEALRRITASAVGISGIYMAMLPFLYPIADRDDAPGLVGIPGGIVFGALVIAVFSGLLTRLLREAIAMKSENDLTV